MDKKRFRAVLESPEHKITVHAVLAHKRLKLPPPSVEEISNYKAIVKHLPIKAIAASQDVDSYPGGLLLDSLESLAAQKQINTILDLRRKTLGRGGHESTLQSRIYSSLLSYDPEPHRLGGFGIAHQRSEYKKLALHFSKLIAAHYRDVDGNPPSMHDNRFRTVLWHLARHLYTEVGLCIEADIPKPGIKLRRDSVFDLDARTKRRSAGASIGPRRVEYGALIRYADSEKQKQG